jgi:hypothetical protein
MRCKAICWLQYSIALAAAIFLASILIIIALMLGNVLLVVLIILWLVAEIAKISARYRECVRKCKE